MERSLQIVGLLMVLVAIVHSAQHFISGTGLEGGATGPIWSVLDWVMVVGLAVSIWISFRRFTSSGSEDVTERLLASFLALFVVVTSILFIEQWFSQELLAPEGYEITPERLALWEAIDIMYILVMGWIGVHLIRSKGADAR